jgi:uncharacterized protein involved in response to NO
MRVYRYAFILAALAAAKPVLPAITEDITGHQRELIFGFLGLQLFGFLAASLPRWLGRPLQPAPLIVVLLVLHGLALLWSFPVPEMGFQARTLVTLFAALVFAVNAVAARAWRAGPVLALTVVHAVAGVVVAYWPAAETVAIRVGFGAIVLLCCEITTRIVAALVPVARERHGLPAIAPPPPILATVVRYGGIVTFLAWAGAGVTPDASAPTAVLAVAAAATGAAGLAWLARLRPIEVAAVPGLGVLLLGVVFMRGGFVLLALAALGLGVEQVVAVHAFAIGGLAMLAIGIATSIVRRREETAFVRSPIASAAYAGIAVTVALRLAANLAPEHYDSLLTAARNVWTVAFAFYAAFVAKGLLEKDKKAT